MRIKMYALNIEYMHTVQKTGSHNAMRLIFYIKSDE